MSKTVEEKGTVSNTVEENASCEDHGRERFKISIIAAILILYFV